MAKVLRYGVNKLKPVKTLATTQPRTLATTKPRTLATQTKTGQLVEKPVKGREIVTGSAGGGTGSSSPSPSRSQRKSGAGSGGSAASRTDDEENVGSASEEKPPQKLSTLLVRGDIVAELLGGGEAADQTVRDNALFQGNARKSEVGTASRREGGTGYGRGGGGGGAAPKKRTKTAPTSEPAMAPIAKAKPLALPAGKAKPLALPSGSASEKPLALPAGKAKPLALPGPSGKSAIVASEPEVPVAPPSFSGMKASGFTRFIEQVVRSMAQPVEASKSAEEKRSAAVKKALLEGELGKAVDAFVANRIEFESAEERNKTYTWLEKQLRKVQ